MPAGVEKCVLHLQNEIFNCSTIEAITLNEVKNEREKAENENASMLCSINTER
jgi:hypothetical protein